MSLFLTGRHPCTSIFQRGNPREEKEGIYDDVPEGRSARTAVAQPDSLDGSSPNSTRSATAAGAKARLSPSSTLQRPSTPFTCESRSPSRHGERNIKFTGLVQDKGPETRAHRI